MYNICTIKFTFIKYLYDVLNFFLYKICKGTKTHYYIRIKCEWRRMQNCIFYDYHHIEFFYVRRKFIEKIPRWMEKSYLSVECEIFWMVFMRKLNVSGRALCSKERGETTGFFVKNNSSVIQNNLFWKMWKMV